MVYSDNLKEQEFHQQTKLPYHVAQTNTFMLEFIALCMLTKKMPLNPEKSP